MEPIHNRMPVILDDDGRAAWMSGEPADPLLRPYAGELETYPVKPLRREDGPHQILRM